MIKKLRSFWNKHIKYKNVTLTPKGECFRKYCKDISDDKLNSEIFDYETFIDYIQILLDQDHNMKLNRKETAEFILEAYEEIL